MENYSEIKLLHYMERAQKGGELTVGFLGGSITQGSLASSDTTSYAYLVYRWWCDTFPEAYIHYVNGGIGGTTSHFGVSRAVEDVLMYQPDVVFVDFSVNDEPEEFFQETFEGLVRKLLGWGSNPAVVVLNNVYYDTGKNAQMYHNAIAEHYGVPYVSMLDTVYRRMKVGEYTREELTPDGLHPNDKGHVLVAAELIRYLEQVKQKLDREGLDGVLERKSEKESTLPTPLTENAYQNAGLFSIRNCCPVLNGFRADTREKKGHLDFFKNGWIGKKEGDRISFEVECSCIAVQYRKTIQKPSPVARLVLDGNREHAITLDGNFEENWGDCLYLETVLHHGVWKKHSVEIEIVQAHVEDKVPFYLLSLIVA
ncbi:MAG: SGNH/GDSL hydrolase family protein [Lachnospiraceae bacterium]|nr:SGNH/GDSL hydrolase family protein [Lachnospiraceae bacterium]